MVSSEYPSILDTLGHGPPLSLTPVSGGCIADARIARFTDGSEVFVKMRASHSDMFTAEAEGLRALRRTRAIRVPEVLAVDSTALVLERIRPAVRRPDFSGSFGRQFAELHQSRGTACGFPHDNYIGATRQRNVPIGGSWGEVRDETGSKWAEFFIDRRLRFQARLAAKRDAGHELERMLDQSEQTIAGLLNSAIEAPSLLHGDLWAGNAMVDELGEPCLIDPAAYYGHREADLAMTHLFGGFEPSFYRAYHESLPLAPGHDERLPVYQLYHVINHFNLFGGGYFEQARRILQTYI